jgi:NAD(P)-dependent dehydrogenase (short-subunit alcohol dehydrogenase family)
MNAFDLSNQTALITGGGSGIGLGIARCFVAAGARVVLVGRRRAELEAAVAELGPMAAAETGDVTDIGEFPGLVERARRHAGDPTILVNNAGVHLKKLAVDTRPEEVLKVLETHVLGAFELTRLLVPPMLQRGEGTILFIASMASLMGIPLTAAYSLAKSAITGMVRSMASEFSPQGVRVNAIAPGWIETPMMRQALHNDQGRQNKILGRTPMGKFGQVEDIGWAAVYLCSPAGRFVTGTVLRVDGGASIGF